MDIPLLFDFSSISGLLVPIGIGIAMLIILLFLRHFETKQQEEIRDSIYDSKIIPAEVFEFKWIVDRKTKMGYKYNDGPGCYVILIYDNPVQDGQYQKYDDIYIGQSVNVCQRVHTHLNGKGNGDVYADRRAGRYLYVTFIRCAPEQMNAEEKKYIAAFNATASYNQTRGGSKKR